MGKERFWIRVLRKLGIIEEQQVSKKDISERVQKVCRHNCSSCVWNENRE